MERPPLENLRSEFRESPEPQIRLADLHEAAERKDKGDPDPVFAEMVDDLSEKCDRYLNMVLRHQHVIHRNPNATVSEDQQRVEEADYNRRITHNSLIDTFQPLIRSLGGTYQKWYADSIHDKRSTVVRDRIGQWALYEALDRLAKQEEQANAKRKRNTSAA